MGLLKDILTRTDENIAKKGKIHSFSPRSPSMNELSMGAADDLVDFENAINSVSSPPSSASTGTPVSASGKNFVNGATLWRSVFNPGRNFHPAMRSAQIFDDGEKSALTVWDHVLNSKRKQAFESLEMDEDGYIHVADLKTALGRGDDIEQLIQAAGKNKDGKVDRKDFKELLKNSIIPQ